MILGKETHKHDPDSLIQLCEFNLNMEVTLKLNMMQFHLNLESINEQDLVAKYKLVALKFQD
jgi:hypothetical protein